MYHRTAMGAHEGPAQWGQDWPPGFTPPGEKATAKDRAALAASQKLLAKSRPGINLPLLPPPPGKAAAAEHHGAAGGFSYGLIAAVIGGGLLVTWLLTRKGSVA